MSISQSFIDDVRSLLDVCKCYNIDVHTNEFDKLFFDLNIPNTNVGDKVGFFQDTITIGLEYEYCIIRDFNKNSSELDVSYEIIKVINDLTLIKINVDSNESINTTSESEVVENKLNAWVYVVWGNIKYLIGAIVSAYSLKKLNTKHKIVLMYDKNLIKIATRNGTPGVLISNKWADSTELLEIPSELTDIFDEIIPIDLIQLNSVLFGTVKQQQLYNKTFNDYSINKWQCLNLIQYNKVCFIDSDIIFINKDYNEFELDDIFNITTPAGCFTNPFLDKFTRQTKPGIRSYYTNEMITNNNDIIPSNVILKSLKDSTVISGGMVLLTTKANEFDKLIKYAKSVSVKIGKEIVYGNKNCYSGIDEQLISEYYASQNINWHYIHQIYQMIPWHYKNWYPQLLNYNASIGLHYYHDKPWELGQGNDWPDVVYWWNIYITLPDSLKTILNEFIPQKLVSKYDKPQEYWMK